MGRVVVEVTFQGKVLFSSVHFAVFHAVLIVTHIQRLMFALIVCCPVSDLAIVEQDLHFSLDREEKGRKNWVEEYMLKRNEGLRK